MSQTWKVTAVPHEEYDSDSGKNLGGIKVLLTDGEDEREVARVGYDRKHTDNPKKSFDWSLQNEIKKAQKAAETLNELLHGDEPAGLR